MTKAMANHASGFRAVAASLAVLTSSLCSASPPWYTPAKGNSERVQIMDELRAELVKFDATSQELIFVVKELCVSPTVGWLAVAPQSRDGKNRLETIQATLKRGTSSWRVDKIACGEEDCPKGTDATALRARVKPQCPSQAE